MYIFHNTYPVVMANAPQYLLYVLPSFLLCHLCSTFAMGTLLGQGTCPGTSQIQSLPLRLSPKLAGLYSASCWTRITWDLHVYIKNRVMQEAKMGVVHSLTYIKEFHRSFSKHLVSMVLPHTGGQALSVEVSTDLLAYWSMVNMYSDTLKGPDREWQVRDTSCWTSH